MAYSVLKRLLPHSLRTFLRDLDSAYQERLKEIEIKNQQIEELQHTLQESQNRLLKEIEIKNQQIEELQHTSQESQNRLLKEIEIKNQQLIELESNSQKLSEALESQKCHIQESNLSEEDYEKLSKAGLFIIATARSGTSILCDCLNLSPDVFLLGEANLYIHHNLDNFVDFFNIQHIQFKNRRSKGTFAPPSRLPERGGINFLSRMNKNYNFVGEKIAFGPHGEIDNQSFQEVFFNFHARYFYFSNYILIMRRPAEAVFSMLKMFPEKSLDVIFDCWLRTVKIQIDVFQSFPYSYVIFFEHLSSETVMNLCSLIGVNIHIPKEIFREENKYSLLAKDEIPDELLKYGKVCLACEEIYKQVKNEFNLETFKFKETTANYGNAAYGFSHKIQKQIDEIIHGLGSVQC